MANHGDLWVRTTLGALGDLSTSSVDKLVRASEIPVRLVNYMDVYRERFIRGGLLLQHVTATSSEVSRFQVEIGDILFTPSSETPNDIGHSAVVADSLRGTLHSYHTVRLRPNGRTPLDLRFSGWFANADYVRAHLATRATGSTRYTLTLRELEATPIYLPNLIVEQRRIAKVLDTADEAIRQTQALIARLKQMKQGLLHDLLTRGLDENGELRDPDAHPEQFMESPLGRIPIGWMVAPLGEIAAAPICYGIVQPGPFVSRGVPIFAINNLGAVNLSVLHRCAPGVEALYTRSRVTTGDVLLSIKGTVGRVGIVPDGFNGNISRELARIRPMPGLLGAYLSYLLLAPQTQYRATQMQVGTTRSEFSIGVLKRFLLPIAGTEEQQRIVSAIAAHDARIRAEEAYLAKLQLLKKGLMQDLLTGRVRVPVPEREPELVEAGA